LTGAEPKSGTVAADSLFSGSILKFKFKANVDKLRRFIEPIDPLPTTGAGYSL
jgi:hypothetical protein